MDARPRLFTRPLSSGQLIALDTLAAVAYTNVFLTPASAQTPLAAGDPGVPVWVPYLVVAGIGLPAAVRRRWPLPVFGIVFVMSVLSVLLDIARDYFVAAAFALYLVALTQPRRRWVPTAAIGALSVAGILLLAAGGSPNWPADRFILPADRFILVVSSSAVMGAAWTAGRAVRERRAYAGRTAEQVADRAVTEERLRIARELHDVVAHSMSLIAVKAGVANHVMRSRPQEARDALRVIETTSRNALAEMRHLLGVLRTDGHPGQVPADMTPVPGPAGLRELAEGAGAAGVHVNLEVRGADRLPEGVGLSVYRIVQEALTNVVKHAAPTRCRVVVADDDGEVIIEVTDEGSGNGLLRHGHASGHGLIGVRERVAMYGGTFTAGPRPEGGFELAVHLPYEPTGPTS